MTDQATLDVTIRIRGRHWLWLGQSLGRLAAWCVTRASIQTGNQPPERLCLEVDVRVMEARP